MPPRIELITEKSQIPAEQHHEYDEIVGVLGRVGGPFGILMYSPGLAEMVCKTGAHVRLQSSLTMVERELVILTLCREKDAAYEWAAHVGTARKAGMREEAIEVIRNGGDTSGLEPDERDIIDYTRQLLRNNKVDQKLFDALRDRHDTRWLVEITATAGQYSYISCINNAFGMEPAADAPDKLPVK
ncbi:MAG TPA: carboxymuconolactone decarboxylase family protein [Dehalococcoidia bacterium]|jgi:alkylhydroperoxidase family enzyme|nr:carboxymuconolactone decarboxylase family protein [Dehalococcoidia bacterium]